MTERKITPEATGTLQSLQDLVHVSTNNGSLRDIFDGITFQQGRENIDLASTPGVEQAFVGGIPVFGSDISINWLNLGDSPNWVGFHKRRWMRHQDMYLQFVLPWSRIITTTTLRRFFR